MDMSGNGYLSLAEVDKGMRDVIKLPRLFDTKEVLRRAFVAAKTKAVSKDKFGDDFVTKSEYRYLLKYLRQYYEYWVMFEQLDADSDRRIDFNEFKKAALKMAKWGVDMSDPQKAFDECDDNKGGYVLFDEFCSWAISKSLDLSDDDDAASDISEGEGTKPTQK